MKPLFKVISVCFILICVSASTKAQTADFSSDVISGCNPLVVAFTDKSTGTSSSTIYSWEFGDSKTSSLKNPTTTYIAPGTYTVKLTVKNGSSGTPSVKTATITVYPSPTVSYTSTPLSGCPCTNVTFTNTSVPNAPGAYTSIWSFGDGYTATTNNTAHLYCTPGSYNVVLKVTNSAGCVATKLDTAKVIIVEKPLADFSASKVNLCKLPDSTVFTASVTKGKPPYTYNWDFGDGIGTSTLATPKYGYSLAGTYPVRLIVTDANGCKDTLTKLGYIKAVPMNSDFKVPNTICAGGTLVMFENTSVPTPLSTRWIWSDGGGATGMNPQRNYWKGGTYGITMIDSFGPGCIDTAIKNYVVNPKPKQPNFSYSPIYPCPAPATITFTNKTSSADSFLWVFGDKTTSKEISPVHTYTWDSVFTVYLIAKTSFGCLDTFRVRDTTKAFPGGYPNPYYDSSNSPIIIRVHKGDVDIFFDSATGGCIPFTIRPVALMCGCSKLPADTASYCSTPPVKYFSPPYWKCAYPGHPTDAYPDEYADPYTIKSKTTCIGPNAHPYPIASYLWDFGDGTGTTTVDSPSHTYTVEGEYWVKVTVTTHNGCTYTDSTLVAAGTKPIANFSAAPTDICIHDSVTFTNASSKGFVYRWLFGDGGIYVTNDSHKVYKYRYDKSGTFRAVLQANRYGCIDTMSLQITVRPPQAVQEIKYFCDSPLKVQFIDSSKGATSTLWRFGDGNTSTAKYPIHRYASPGIYTVSQIVHNSVYNCWDSTTFQIDLFVPKPFFSTPDTTICKGDTITYYDSARSYFINWYWYTSTFKQTDTPNSFKVKYKDTGIYSVLYVGLDKHNCLDSFYRKNYVLVAKPQMKIWASPILACAPSTVSFIDSSTNTKGAFNVSRTWFWGDFTSTTDTAKKASKIYSVPGSYTVKLITTDNVGCKDSTELVIESRRPKANFAADLDTFTCIGRPVKFYNSVMGADVSFVWDFGDGGTSTLPNPVYTYSTIGTFNVKLVVTDGTGCKDSITKIAFVKTTKPNASFSLLTDSVALCPPLLVSLTNSSTGAVRYAWDLGNGSTASIPSPGALYVDSGIYIIRLVAFDARGCSDTTYRRARVLGYDGAFKYSQVNGCAPFTVDFEAELINAEVMVWDFADGYTESAKGKLKISHTYTDPGYYVPRLILGDGKGCSTSSKGLDTIKVDDVTPVISSSPACEGSLITFNDSSYSYFSTWSTSEWIFEDGTKFTGKNPTRTYAKAGTYLISLITTNTNGCRDTLAKNITIHPLPKIQARDTVICLGDQATLSASGGVSYYWTADPSLSCSDCNSPITSSRVPIKYYVKGTDANGCVNFDTLDLGIKTKTTLVLAKNEEVCEQTPIELKASGAQQYLWTPPTFLSNPNIANPIATMDSTIVYQVIGKEGSCIPDTAFLKVTVYPLPEVDAGPDQKVLAGTSVQLNGTGKNIKNYLWSPVESLSCIDCPSPTAKPLKTTVYTLKATSDFGCSDSDDVQIVIFCDQSQLFIPNSFTPNGDGQNDYFYPQGSGIGKVKSFIVYNRWGQKVFERINMDVNIREQGWDGTFAGDKLNSDTFVYTLEAACDNGETVFWKGDITLISINLSNNMTDE